MDPFFDTRNHGYARVAAVIPEICLANPMGNVKQHLEELEKVHNQGAIYALCPELGLTGYSCDDLFHQEVLLSSAKEALALLIDETKDWAIMVSVGMPLQVNGSLYNVAVTFYKGLILGITPKSHLPNYNEFKEARYFAVASDAKVDTVKLLGQKVEFGNNLLIHHPICPNFILHTEICEDLWVPIPPSAEAALMGATVLANLSASNITIGKPVYRQQLVVGSSARNIAVQMYCAAGVGESTTDLSWDGHAMVAERGTLLVTSKRFQLKGHHIIVDADLASIMRDRMHQTSFVKNGHTVSRIFRDIDTQALNHNLMFSPYYPYNTLLRRIDPHPFVPSDKDNRNERCEEIFLIQVTALVRRLKMLPEKMRKVVIGVSGGQDSTHALSVAVYAMDMIKLSRENVIAITMPGFGTTSRTKNNAIELCKALGVTLKEIPIEKIALEVFDAIGHDKNETSLVFENTQAWSRKLVELATACKFGGIVLGTGDLSELLLGWCTMFGDHASHYGINAGVPKTLISFLIKWTAEVTFKKEKGVQNILLDILDTPISPELLPPDGEKITQITEDQVGPYELHDFFAYYFIRLGYSPVKIARLAIAAFLRQNEDTKEYSLAEIKKWLGVFLTRLFANQFKRTCLPDGPKVGIIAISPRGDWRMPSDAEVTAWMDNWATIPGDV